MSALLNRIRIMWLVSLLGTVAVGYAANTHQQAVAQNPAKATRPSINTTFIADIKSDDSAHEFLLKRSMLDLTAIQYRMPVPSTGEFSWIKEPLILIPAASKRLLKDYLCSDIVPSRKKLCDNVTLHETGRRSENLLSLGYIDVLNRSIESQSDPIKVLIIAGTHGDEPSSVTLSLNWLDAIINEKIADVYWRFIPALNPDGLLSRPRMRTNARGVDLNRNMPTLDWQTDAFEKWISHSKGQQRFYPGQKAASEPETRFLVEQIDAFMPDIIVSIHAPYNLVDYDFSSLLYAPPNIGQLKLRRLGSFPGSLGRYSGYEREIPTLTIELEDARHVPSKAEYQDMLADLVYWVNSTHAGTSVVSMPSTRRNEIIAQTQNKQKKKKAVISSEREDLTESEYNQMPMISQPYIIKEHKKINVVPVIL